MKDFSQWRQECGLSPVWIRWCTERWINWRKVLWHEMHTKGLSPECVRLCTSKLGPEAKEESHSLHEFDLVSLCTLICLARNTVDSKVFLQILHSNSSLTDECDFAWYFRWLVVRNSREQIVHWWGFSPVWDLIWISRCALKEKLFPQVWHFKVFTPLWVLLWFFKLDELIDMLHVGQCSLDGVWCALTLWLFNAYFVLNDLPHRTHFWGFSFLWLKECILRFPSCKNNFPHIPHENGFSSVWISWCSLRLESHKRFFPQMRHSTAITSNLIEVQHLTCTAANSWNCSIKNINKVPSKRKWKLHFRDFKTTLWWSETDKQGWKWI